MESGSGIASPSSPRSFSGRRESANHHVERRESSNGSIRKPFSVATLGRRLRQWWARQNQENDQKLSMIPRGLAADERSQYNTLLDVVAARSAKGTTAPRIVVITDLAKDYDDLAALLVLKELHRLGVVVLLGLIANLEPADLRAKFGRGALNELNLRDIPIARGTSGYPRNRKSNRKHKLLDYEFDCDFMDKSEAKILTDEGEGERLLKTLCEDAVQTGQKLTLLLISSLEDIYSFSEINPKLLKDAVCNVVLQGGYQVTNGKLEADPLANNNRYDEEAAIRFHHYMQESQIPSVVYTKHAAFATPLTSELFHDLERTGHKLGVHLRKVQIAQDLAFYEAASQTDEKKRFAPFMDQEWFLKNKTYWYEKNKPGTPFPKGKEVIKWLDKLVVYDALSAIGSAGADAVTALGILTDEKASAQPPSIHKVVGFAGPPVDTGIHSKQMATVLSALMKGSLLHCQEQIQ